MRIFRYWLVAGLARLQARAHGLRWMCAVLVTTSSLGLCACGSGGSGQIDTEATFSDVSSLTTGASVQLADIDVGSVTGIHLRHDQALVTMAIDRSARVPANVTAELVQTTVLGQYVVALVPTGHGTALLHDHQPITRSTVVPGIQQLVQSGTEVFAAVNGSELSQLIDNTAQGLNGQGGRLRTLLDDFGTVLAGYASQTHQITTLIDRLDQFAGTLAPDAGANAQAVSNLARTTSTLAEQSNQFVGLLQSLDALATQGRSILATGLPDIETNIDAIAAVAHQLDQHQQQLASLLQEVPVANQSLASATYHNYLQVLNNIIVCGVPGLGAGTAATDTCGANGAGL